MGIKLPPVHPEPISKAYRPSISITELPATAPVDHILKVIERDGGVILTGFATSEQLAAIDQEILPYTEAARQNGQSGIPIIPKETTVVPGLVGKSDTIAQLCELPVLDEVRTQVLEDRFTVQREDVTEQNRIDPLLSISITLYIGHGAPRQRLHRDDNIHGVRHGGQWSFKDASQIGCLIAGSRTTRENGATMFIPGSHRWDDTRKPQPDEVCFAEMEPGSALIFLASCYHGGGHNSVPGEVRKIHGLFFTRGTFRTEENQFLAVPRSKVMKMSNKMLSLLGYKKPTTVLGVVDNVDPADDLEAAFRNVSA